MLNLDTFTNLVNLAQNATIGSDARITIASQNARTGATTFNTTETSAFSRLGERLLRSDADKTSYGNVRAKLITTLTDLFGVKNENHLPSAVRAAFVFGQTSCDRPLTQRRLQAVLTTAAHTLGYADLAAMKRGVEIRHQRYQSNHFSMPKALMDPVRNANVVINGKRVSELTETDKAEIFQTETAKRFDMARDIVLGDRDWDEDELADAHIESLDDVYGTDEDDEMSEGEDFISIFHGPHVNPIGLAKEEIDNMRGLGQEFLGYYNTVADEHRVAKDINARRESDLTMKFEKALKDPVAAQKAVDKLNIVKNCGLIGGHELACLIGGIHNSMLRTLDNGTPSQVAKIAKFLDKLGDFDPTDGKAMHKMIKAYGHVKYVDNSGGKVRVEELGKNAHVDSLYSAMMKRINANIKAFVDKKLKPGHFADKKAFAAAKKTLIANMMDFALKLSPLGQDIGDLSVCRYGDVKNRKHEVLDDALNTLAVVADKNPNFKVNASTDVLLEIASEIEEGENTNRFQEKLAAAEEESDAKIFNDEIYNP